VGARPARYASSSSEDIRDLKSLDAPVKGSDEISIVPAIAGAESTSTPSAPSRPFPAPPFPGQHAPSPAPPLEPQAQLAVAGLVGSLFVRLRSDYFALVNLALAVIIYYPDCS